MAVIGYARVSTEEQTLDSQLGELERNGASRVFSDVGVSGAVPAHRRPGFAELLRFVRDGDVVLAYRLDRVSRSASDALNLVERLDAIGVELRTLA
ncbi:MAG TPA: recombinase family protein, partial [Protaetiibacter sp.]|nr:recombinase family protein [Protaetiibacter sp.]